MVGLFLLALLSAVVAYVLPGTPAHWAWVRVGNHGQRFQVQPTHAVDVLKVALYVAAVALAALAGILHDDRITTAEMLREGSDRPDLLHRTSYALTNLLRF